METSIWQEPEFGTSKHYGKAHRTLLSGQMICNNTVSCKPTTVSPLCNFQVQVQLQVQVQGHIVTPKIQKGPCKTWTMVLVM